MISQSHFSSLAKQAARRIALLALAFPLLHAHAQTLLDVPKVAGYASDHGPARPDESATVTVHLQLRDQAGFDKAVEDLYRIGSPTFHRWMTPAEIAAYGATEGDLAAVKQELESHGLKADEANREDSSIRARGTISQLESAFQTSIHEFEREGRVFHSNVTPASLTGAAGSLVKSVSGLSNLPMKSDLAFVRNSKTGAPRPFVKVKAGTAPVLGNLFTNKCFSGAISIQLNTLPPPLPVATYFGNVYGASSLPCGWTPAQLQNYYGLQQAYQAGYEGAGQTIVIVDGPSYGAQVAADFFDFSKWTGLPTPTKGTFQIVYPDGEPNPYTLQYLSDWTQEADLDAQWAHAIAPKAKIVLLIMPTEDWSELEYGIQYAVQKKLGNVISNSYGYPEFLWARHIIAGFEQTLEAAAAAGVTVNFSSGDSGDAGTGAPNAGGASYPATSAYATAVGGTSIDLLNVDGTTSDTGWGTNQNAFLSFGWTSPEPPGAGMFLNGSGGGTSTVIGKPKWQEALPGSGRHEPDIADIADPYTGVVVVYNGQLGAIGGTSAASPVFSAIWSLASEKAGAPLGQAAPLFAALPQGAVNDVLPLSSPEDVVGFYIDATGSTYWSAAALSAPLENTAQFYSALWDENGNNSGVWVVQSFGTDSSLTVAPGWDNVTGWGSPNGSTFISDVAATVKPKK